MNRAKYLLITIFIASNCLGLTNWNLFNPYDVLLLPPVRPNECWQFTVAGEWVIKERSYQSAEDEYGEVNCFRKHADPLQLYQDEQDFLAALKGNDYTAARSQLGQQFNIDDDNGTEGLLIPCGKFDAQNWMFSARRYLNHGFFFSLHLPLISMKLKNVSWRPGPNNTITTFDSEVTNDFVAAIEQVGHINLYDWHRVGIGDLAAIMWWQEHFPQARPILHDVRLQARGGFLFPTGSKIDNNVMLGLPFGYDASLGIIFGGNLELTLGHYCLFGIDVELLYLFGKTRQRRIKTDEAQTDLLFLQKACTFTEPGFTQHYTLYGRFQNFWRGASLGLAYQYTKQQDTFIFLGTDHFNASLANTAESLQDWTVHNIVASVNYDFYGECYDRAYKPYVSLLYKHGFNGSRSVVADTITALIAVDF